MSVKSIARIIGSLVAIVAILALYFLDRSQFPAWVNLWWAIGIAGASALITSAKISGSSLATSTSASPSILLQNSRTSRRLAIIESWRTSF